MIFVIIKIHLEPDFLCEAAIIAPINFDYYLTINVGKD